MLERELHLHDHSVRAQVRSTPAQIFDKIPLEIVKGDLHNKSSIAELVKDCDALIHCAALISIQGDPTGEVRRTNVDGTRNVMHAAQQAGLRRVVHISSIHSFQQNPSKDLLDEHREKVNEKAFAYDQSKRDGEEIALSYTSAQMEVLVMNPTAIIGPYDYKPSRMGKVILDLYSGKLPFVIDGGFDFCDSRDVATAIVNGLTMGYGGQSYLLSGQWHTIKEVSVQLARITGQKIKVVNLPDFIALAGLPFVTAYGWLKKETPIYTREALVAILDGNRKISSAKARRELAYKTRPLEDTLRDTWLWFRENGYLDR